MLCCFCILTKCFNKKKNERKREKKKIVIKVVINFPQIE